MHKSAPLWPDIYKAWPQGTSGMPTVVTVYLDTAWTNTSQINALKQAFTNWGNLQNTANCNCNVVFQYTSTEGGALTVDSSQGWFLQMQLQRGNNS